MKDSGRWADPPRPGGPASPSDDSGSPQNEPQNIPGNDTEWGTEWKTEWETEWETGCVR